MMQITDHIHALKIPFQIPVGPGKSLERFVYVYLVFGQEICLIDSGVKDSERIIFDYLKKRGHKPEEISLLILTHAHPDHIGAAQAIKQASGCSVAAHPDAQAWIEDVELQFKQRPVPGFHTLVGGSTSIDRLLRDGENIECGPISLEVILTPGHAKGSLSFYCKEEKVLFSGDVIPQKNDQPIYDDAVTVAASIKRLKSIPVEYLLASWTDPLKGSGARKMMDEGLAYLQQIHTVVREIAKVHDAIAPMELCARTVKVLGLPEVAVNPLIAKSLASHLPVIDTDIM
jgi:glyoxylase-like metal-dependent hydrolase (beta-lactamase superfamily II)